MMKTLKLLASAIALLTTTAAQAAYLPTGVQTNVTKEQVTEWGWTVCYQDDGNADRSVDSILSSCGGRYMMLADATFGSDSYAVLAAAARDDVLFDLGNVQEASHEANGAQWYFSREWSWGYSELGNPVRRWSCDINLAGWGEVTPTTGSCWHTSVGMLSSGWGFNDGDTFRSSQNRYILVADQLDAPVDVPEPAGLAILASGLAGLIGARRAARRAQG